ncbi:MAG: glycosyltransferase family 2 protein [Desulfomonilaceae bacterium]|jgi:glycosyltransferase
MQNSTPKISVVTPSLNNFDTIRVCIESIQQQTVRAQHIIIDGVSRDGSLELIRQVSSPDSIIVSESDNSEYDAMNKGLALADGDFVGILNADDYYAHDKVLEKVLNVFLDPEVGACYGDLVYVDQSDTSNVKRYWKAKSFRKERFYSGWMPPHPTFFLRRELLAKYGYYRLDFSSAADYEFMLRYLLKYQIKARYIPDVLVKMRIGGKSNFSLKQRLIANRFDRKAWDVNGLKPRPWTLILKPLSKIGQYLFPNKRCCA